jgi:hypothetical protein
VVFVDLLRGDDHTLSEMVEDSGNFSEVEAMAKIDRFIFETKTAIARRGSVTLEGFGTMTIDHKGVYQFHHTPGPRLVKERAVQEKLFGEGTPARPAPSVRAENPRPREGVAPPQAKAGEKVATAARPQSVARPTRQPARPTRKPASGKKLSGIDIILILAMIAAVIALVAMAFGLTAVNEMPFMLNK